ncbi:MAG: hypothetical protein M0P31_15455 [Solirubrobacteraceae bacterium]|nr:hypothetical protein [Solirubrobacteraceae bacterium]
MPVTADPLTLIRTLATLERDRWPALSHQLALSGVPLNEGDPDPAGEGGTAPAGAAPAAPSSDPPADPPADPVGGDGPATFDREYVEKLRRENARYRSEAKDADELRKRMQDIEDAEKSDLEREKAAREKAEQRAAQLEREALRRKVADEHKLPADLVEFLPDGTEDEMAAKAKILAARLPAPKPSAPQVPGGPQGDTKVMSAEQARSLAKTDPAEFNRKFEAGEIPADALASK